MPESLSTIVRLSDLDAAISQLDNAGADRGSLRLTIDDRGDLTIELASPAPITLHRQEG